MKKRREQLQNISVLLSVKPLEAFGAVEKLKGETERLKEALSKNGKRIIEMETAGLKKRDGRLYLLEPDFDGLMLRHLANRMLEEGRGETVLALGETAGGFLYVLGSRTEDMRQLSKELNGLLSRPRRRKPADGAGHLFLPRRESVSAVLKNCGFRPAKESGDEPGERGRL